MSAITNRKLQETVGVHPGAVDADGSGGVTTEYVDATVNRKVLVHAQVSSGNVSTIQFREATDDEGTDAQDLGEEITVDASDGHAEIDAAELSDGFTHVAAVVTADGANPTAATLVTGQSRFN